MIISPRLQLLLVKGALVLLNTPPRHLFICAVGFLSALLMTFLILSRPASAPRPAEGLLKADRLQPVQVRVIPITRSLPIPAAALTPAEPAGPPLTPMQRVAMADPLTNPVQDAKADLVRSDDNRQSGSLNRGRTSPDRGHSDICARHGGRRVELHGGRSWRCVYARR